MPFGRIYKDGRLIGDDEAMGIRDRRKLSFAGHVAVNVVLDDEIRARRRSRPRRDRRAEADASGEPLEELMLDAAIGAIDSIPRAAPQGSRPGAEAVRRAVRGAANEAWGKKPL